MYIYTPRRIQDDIYDVYTHDNRMTYMYRITYNYSTHIYDIYDSGYIG